MSFEHSTRLESQPTTFRRQDDPEYSDDPEFHRFTTDLSEKLINLQSKISRLNSDVAALGTKRENARVRERVQDLLEETSSGFREIHEGLKKVQDWHDLGVRILQLPKSWVLVTGWKLTKRSLAALPKIHPKQTQPRSQSHPRRIPSPPARRRRKTTRLRYRRPRRARRIRHLAHPRPNSLRPTTAAATRTRAATSGITR